MRRKDYFRRGDIRLKSFFSFLPIIVKGELRWLEHVTVKQRYLGDIPPGLYAPEISSRWINVSFM